MQNKLTSKNVELNVSAEAKEWLAHHGYSPAYGARPLRRLIQDKIKKPLAKELLFHNKDGTGARVTIRVDDNQLIFDWS